jgi:AraC-like DNA-binding protein
MLDSPKQTRGSKLRDDRNLDAFLQHLEYFKDIQCIAISFLDENFMPETPGPILCDPQEYSKLKRTVNNMLCGFGIKPGDTCWITREKLETVIINKLKKEQVHSLMKQLSFELSRGFSFSTTIACGEFISDVHDINYAYTSSLGNADYARLLKNDLRFIDQEIKAELWRELSKKYPDYGLENYHRALVNAIFQGDFTWAEMIINYYIIAHFNYQILDFMLLRDRLHHNILHLVLSLVVKNVHVFHSKDMRFYEVWERIKKSIRLEELQAAVNDFFILISDLIKPMKEYGIRQRKIQPIIDYIRENFTDPLISETQVCEKFNMSVSYLSHAFKEQMGMGFSFYLQTLRIEKAKQLMTSSNDSVDVIARKIGYSSGESLLKLFKRIEKINPSQYRNCYFMLDRPKN